MNNSHLYFDFSHLDSLSADQVLLLKNKVIEIVKQKFAGTGVEVTDSMAEARSLMENGFEVKQIYFHDGDFIHKIAGSTGETITEMGEGIIDINNLTSDPGNFDLFAEEAGMIASHEAGHMFIPGHSINSDSLLAEGSSLSELVKEGKVSEIEFTDFQKLLISDGMPPGFSDLATLENHVLKDLAGGAITEDGTEVLEILKDLLG